jgi:cytoskeletal protein CcmA (bactofilin family)
MTTREDGTHVTKEFRGSISLRDETVIIDNGVIVHGDVYALNVEICADAIVKGNVFASNTTTLRKDSHLEGDVTTAKISIEDGAYFKGGADIIKGGG